MINIERSLLCSIMEHNFVGSEKEIIAHTLDHKLFKHRSHRVFVQSINRLKELDEPICSDTIRMKLMSVNKWSIELESDMLQIMAIQPFGAHETFLKYYKFIEEEHRKELRKEVSLMI